MKPLARHKLESLATRMRPSTLETFWGQQHLLAPNAPLEKAIRTNHLHSMIFWGPPGTGKTTLALLIAFYTNAHLEKMSAVSSGIKEIRDVIERAEKKMLERQQYTILFIDEIHRFNKAQQDSLLPAIEEGSFILIGATTENPSFELRSALLSRLQVYILESLKLDELLHILNRALTDSENGLGNKAIMIEEETKQMLASLSDGDARRALNLLEIAAEFAQKGRITQDVLKEIVSTATRRFDKGGDYFYNQISALHKAIRGTDPDASLYWLCRMLDGGCDPIYIARRLTRVASEDIGNADPRALEICLNTWEVQKRLGSPEGELALAQAVVYLACAPKSNAVYMAFKAAMKDAQQQGSLEVPLHLRNAPTSLMKQLGYGKDYRYAHHKENAYASGENYFPSELTHRQYYHPTDRGLEVKIKEKLEFLRKK